MKERWINIAKFLAIMAVMLDHVRFSLYENRKIQLISFYSVSLFILVMGITTYRSYSNCTVKLGKKVLHRIKGIVLPYIGAVVIYSIVINHSFKLIDGGILQSIVSFNISGPFYYVLLYLEMLLISPLVYVIVNRAVGLKKWLSVLVQILCGIVIVLITAWTMKYSDLLSTCEISVKLFGGSYLILFYLGMLFSAHKTAFEKIAQKWVWLLPGAILSFGLAFFIWNVMSKQGLVFDIDRLSLSGLNPPGLTLMLYSLSVLGFVYCITKLLEKFTNKIVVRTLDCLGFFGRHTLYIFLYHRLFLDYLLKGHSTGSVIANWLVFIAVMIGGSLIIEFVMRKISAFVVYSYEMKKS